MLGWPRFAVGVCLRALRAARPFSVSPPAGGFAGLARRRLGFASARPPFVSRFARRRPPRPPVGSGCLRLRRRRLLWRPSAWFRSPLLRRVAPAPPSPRSSVARVLPACSLLCAAAPGPPCRFVAAFAPPARGAWSPRFARLLSPRWPARVVWLGFARCAFSPLPSPRWGERCSVFGGVCRLGSVVAERKREVDKGLAWLLVSAGLAAYAPLGRFGASAASAGEAGKVPKMGLYSASENSPLTNHTESVKMNNGATCWFSTSHPLSVPTSGRPWVSWCGRPISPGKGAKKARPRECSLGVFSFAQPTEKTCTNHTSVRMNKTNHLFCIIAFGN